MLAAILLQAASAGQDLDSLLDAVKAHSWVAAAVAGVALVVAVVSKLGLLDKLTGKAPAPAAPAVDPKPAADASKASDLLDGKK